MQKSRGQGRSVAEIFPIQSSIQQLERGPRGVKTQKRKEGKKGEGKPLKEGERDLKGDRILNTAYPFKEEIKREKER